MWNKAIIALLSLFVLYAFCNVVKAAPILPGDVVFTLASGHTPAVPLPDTLYLFLLAIFIMTMVLLRND